MVTVQCSACASVLGRIQQEADTIISKNVALKTISNNPSSTKMSNYEKAIWFFS